MADFYDNDVVFKALNELRKKRKGQFIENITAVIKMNYGWSSDLIHKVIEDMVSSGLLLKVTVNKKVSYRTIKKDDVVVFDNITPTQNKDDSDDYKSLYNNLNQEFLDFKKYVFDELALLREKSVDKTYNSPSQFNHNNSGDLISCLNERINSLEQQLKDKQKVIEMLISPNKIVDNNNISPNKNIQPPAGKKLIKNSKIDDERNFPAKTTPLTSAGKKKNVALIIGDSILNGIHENGIKLKDKSVSIKPYSGATSEDIYDFIKPEIRKCPETVVIHIGTNDLSRNIKTIDNLKNISDYVTSKSKNTKIILSTLTIRTDNADLQEKAKNKNQEVCCKQQIIIYG